MGLRSRQARKSVSRLERGDGADPTVSTITRFLQACGARWYQFCDVLEPMDNADVTVPDAAKELLSQQAIEQVETTAREETRRYARNQQEFFHLKPETPETRVESIHKFKTYRMLENVVQQGVLEILRNSPISVILYPAYRSVARHILGLLWREAKTEEGRAGLMIELPKCPAGICDKLDEKETDWCDMGLTSSWWRRCRPWFGRTSERCDSTQQASRMAGWKLQARRQFPESRPARRYCVRSLR
jgi:transcriptional regulator with XRE-family HTH domain